MPHLNPPPPSPRLSIPVTTVPPHPGSFCSFRLEYLLLLRLQCYYSQAHCYDYEYGPSSHVTTVFQHTVSVLPVRPPSSLHPFYHARCTSFKDLLLQPPDHVSCSRTTCICSITRNTCLVRSCLSLPLELVLSVLSDKTDVLTLGESRTIPSLDTLASPGLS